MSTPLAFSPMRILFTQKKGHGDGDDNSKSNSCRVSAARPRMCRKLPAAYTLQARSDLHAGPPILPTGEPADIQLPPIEALTDLCANMRDRRPGAR